MTYYIYKYVKNNKIIYIGKSTSLDQRIINHKKEKELSDITDIYYFECPNKVIMDAYEFLLIKKYKPKANIVYNNDLNTFGLTFSKEPKWSNYQNFINKKEKQIKEKHLLSPEEKKERQIAGIKKAQTEGKFRGGQIKKINKDKYLELKNKWQIREITKSNFAELLGVSRPTLNKILEEEELYLENFK